MTPRELELTTKRHSSPIRQKRKSGSDNDDDFFHPKSTPGRITKASKIGGQQSVRRKQYGDDWSDVDTDAEVKSEPDSDYGESHWMICACVLMSDPLAM